MELIDNPTGNYRYLTGGASYASGVVAMPGYAIERATLHEPLPYRQGFEALEQYLLAQGRLRAALCAVELRSPVPWSFDGFAEFNRGYQRVLADRKLLVDGRSPLARTTVTPEIRPPAEPSLYAFSYTVPSREPNQPLTFVAAGVTELMEGPPGPESIVRAGETSTEALREKAVYVMGAMQARLNGLGATWADVTTLGIYTVYPLHPFLSTEILDVAGPAAMHGVHWVFSRPPVIGLDFEIDLRGVRHDIWIG